MAELVELLSPIERAWLSLARDALSSPRGGKPAVGGDAEHYCQVAVLDRDLLAKAPERSEAVKRSNRGTLVIIDDVVDEPLSKEQKEKVRAWYESANLRERFGPPGVGSSRLNQAPDRSEVSDQ